MMKTLILALLLSVQSLYGQTFKPNYDEGKVPIYSLPQILNTSEKSRSKIIDYWHSNRRPEIIRLFENQVYGQWPTTYDSLRHSVSNYEHHVMDGKAHLMEYAIKIFRQGRSITINLVLFVPSKQVGPAPVFLLINNRGKENTDPTRVVKSEFWPAEMLIDNGYAAAAFHVSDLAPDDVKSFMNGVLQLYPEQLDADNGMRAVGAWAWGASRVMDFFETDSAIDKTRVIVVGHSRGGKASLWAAAHDERFAMCITNCSGNTGAALSRRQFGERVAVINTAFPHWFTPNYKKYNNRENELPVDQHMLIATIAPRPVYATNASEDLWADPRGTFLALKNSEVVFNLLQDEVYPTR